MRYRFDTVRAGIAYGLAAMLIAVSPAIAQTASPQERAAALKESLARNQAALKKYSWIETTVVSVKGEVKKQEQKQCSYGADGKVVKTPMGAAPPAQEKASGGGRRGGRVKQAVVAKKVGEVKDYMAQVADLVQDYVPPDPQKVQAAQGAGHVAIQPADGGTAVAITDYVKPGDRLAIGFDAALKAIRTYGVTSYVEKPDEDAVTLAVTFATLADGTSYPQQSVLDVKAQNIQVKVTNSGYKKTTP